MTHYQQCYADPTAIPASHEFSSAAHSGNRPFISGVLRCNEEENKRRLLARSPEGTTKLTDPDVLLDLRRKHLLYAFSKNGERKPIYAGEIEIQVDGIDADTAARRVLDFAIEAAKRWRGAPDGLRVNRLGFPEPTTDQLEMMQSLLKMEAQRKNEHRLSRARADDYNFGWPYRILKQARNAIECSSPEGSAEFDMVVR